MKTSVSSAKKQLFVPGLGEVVVTSYQGKRQAILKESAFLVSACAENNKEAIDLLKEKYQNLKKLMEATD